MYRSLQQSARSVAAAVALTASVPALAGMGNTANTYGLFPVDVGTAQAMSMFNAQASALYYNPAYLTMDPRGELTAGLLHGEQELKSDDTVVNDTRSQQQLIALKTNLSELTKVNHPLYFAIIAGVEKFGEEMLAFNSSTSDEGQFLNYGRQPLFLNVGGGTQFLNGINVGASVHISLRSEATLNASSNLAGETQYEELDVTAKPVLRPVLSTSQEWGKIICGHNDDCWIGGLETALTFRGHTEARTSVESNIVIPGTVPDPGILLAIDTIDSYQPDIFAAGLKYNFTDNFRMAVTVEQQNWSDLTEELQRDTVKDQANAQFKDITVPRVGAEWDVNKHLTLRGGVAFQESPLESIRTEDVNYLDNDKVIFGLGSSLVIDNPPILAYPMRLDFGYQFQQLEDRDFELTSSRPGVTNPFATVTAGGEVHVFSGSLTLKF